MIFGLNFLKHLETEKKQTTTKKPKTNQTTAKSIIIEVIIFSTFFMISKYIFHLWTVLVLGIMCSLLVLTILYLFCCHVMCNSQSLILLNFKKKIRVTLNVAPFICFPGTPFYCIPQMFKYLQKTKQTNKKTLSVMLMLYSSFTER